MAERDQDDLGQPQQPQQLPSRRQRKANRKRKAAVLADLSDGEEGSDSPSESLGPGMDDPLQIDSDDEPAGALLRVKCWSAILPWLTTGETS